MTIDLEESDLEMALRADLPPQAVEVRLRRRLLAAGLAVGQGVAASTAVASGTGFVGALTAKLGGLHAAVKLGLVAAVAVPTALTALDSLSAGPGRSRSAIQHQASTSAASNPGSTRAGDGARAETTPTALSGALSSVPEVVARRSQASAAAPAGKLSATNLEERTPRPSSVAFGLIEPRPPESAPLLDQPAASTLAEETRILERAFAELGAGNTAAAAELLREHEQRFPDGLLKNERERGRSKLTELSRGH